MVDITRIDKITGRQKALAKDAIYSDFLTNFNAHPETKQLVRSVDVESVKRAIRNLLLTDQGERLFNPNFGSNIRKYLFENFSQMTTNLLKQSITSTIETYEPRVKVYEVVVMPYEEKNLYDISVVFQVINNPEPVTINLQLYRVR